MRCAERALSILALAALVSHGGGADACGPHFPNRVLEGNGTLLTIPALEFSREIARIPRPVLPETSFPAVPSQDGALADAIGIAVALKARGDSKQEVRATIAAVDVFRLTLRHLPRRESTVRRESSPKGPPPPEPPPGLPRAFDLYLRGLSAWSSGDAGAAVKSWEALVALPAAESRPRLAWAQYMLGRAAVDTSPARAIAWFAALRESVRAGAPDPVGLAAASAGWEARAEFRRGAVVRALTLYHALGDEASLLIVLRAAFADPKRITRLAADPLARRLATAYVASRGGPRQTREEIPPQASWLAAVEAAGVANVEDADRLAWIGYDAGDFDSARRWIARSARSPLVAWIEAKLLLRDGRLADASARLAEAARGFPLEESWNGVGFDSRMVDDFGNVAPGSRLLAEHGAVELSRGDFASALDALLRAGAWLDAAYVAERVLTTDELAEFVRTRRRSTDGTAHADLDATGETPAAAIHYLLARRLARDNRWTEALPHFPAEERSKAERFLARLAEGRDASRDRDVRAAGLRDAARILRADGMEIVGTESSPDWAALWGDYVLSDPATTRPSRENDTVNGATDAERARTAATVAQPDRRFHYRYRAADLAWEAAALMPNEDDVTAAWLCEAGLWIAGRDDKGADRFYKALVRRCGTTALGRAAAERKWFPRAPK